MRWGSPAPRSRKRRGDYSHRDTSRYREGVEIGPRTCRQSDAYGPLSDGRAVRPGVTFLGAPSSTWSAVAFVPLPTLWINFTVRSSRRSCHRYEISGRPHERTTRPGLRCHPPTGLMLWLGAMARHGRDDDRSDRVADATTARRRAHDGHDVVRAANLLYRSARGTSAVGVSPTSLRTGSSFTSRAHRLFCRSSSRRKLDLLHGSSGRAADAAPVADLHRHRPSSAVGGGGGGVASRSALRSSTP